MPPPPPPPPRAAPAPTPRYFRNDAPLSRRNPQKQLFASLTRLLTRHPPASVPPGGGLYHGPLSIAYCLLALHPHYPDFRHEDRSLGGWSVRYVERAQACMADYPGPSARRCGVAEDILCLLAMGAVSARDGELVREVCGFRGMVIGGDGGGEEGEERKRKGEEVGDEWLFGRAGFLWLLRFMRGAFEGGFDEEGKKGESEGESDGGEEDGKGRRGRGKRHGRRHGHSEDAAIRALIDDTADRVIDAIMASPRPWKWHGKAYLGAVHGMTGILTQILLTRPEMASELEPDLGALLSYQYEDDGFDKRSVGEGRDATRRNGGGGGSSGGSGGNWPSSIPPGKDRLVQFCHGAPGIVTSLVSLRRVYAEAGSAGSNSSSSRDRDGYRHRHRDHRQGRDDQHQYSNGDGNGHVNTNRALLRRIDRAIARGRRCIMSRGLLTKEPCLCHGISGNGLALAASVDAHDYDLDHDGGRSRDRNADGHGHGDENRDQHGRDERNRGQDDDEDEDEDYVSYTQFEHFLTYTTGHEMKALARDGMMEPSDEPAGLYTGEAGRAWAWAVADGALGWGFPGYNDL